MGNENKNEKAQRQLQLAKLDEMLWLSTPLGKFMSSMSQQAKKVFPSSKANTLKEIGLFASRILL